MISYTIPDFSWQKLSMDLFHRDSKTYLLVVDFSFPLELISDNVLPFNIQEFKLLLAIEEYII